MARSKAKSQIENTIEPAPARARNGPASEEVARRDEGTLPMFAEPGVALDPRRAERASRGAAARPAADTTTIPEAVRERFLQVGEKWFFPSGDPAFRDQGRKLTTVSENAEVVRTLIEIAKARGWDEITVSGTEEFKRAAWHEATTQKIAVRGFTPTQMDEARLVRALSHRAETGRDGRESPAAAREPPTATRQPSERSAQDDKAAQVAPDKASRKPILFGTLVSNGAENFHFDPNEDMSYFVRLKTDSGREVMLWGKDLERALQESKSQPKIGERIGVVRAGQEPVTVPKKERDQDGRVVREYDLHTHRNEWTVESEAFFKDRARLAEVVRDRRIDPQRAVLASPELAGTYDALEAAKLFAERRLADPHDRARFVATVRQAIVREIRNGDPLYAPARRERAPAAVPLREAPHFPQ
jgi:hypothetical protein